MGRPSTFTQKIADIICQRLAGGESLRSICRDEGMPVRRTVHRWISDDINGFRHQYACAKALGLEEMADEIIEISDGEVAMTGEGKLDGADVQHKRLRVDSRKWLLSKLAPKKYGDKSSLELTGEDGGPVAFTDTERAARIQTLLAVGESRKRKESDNLDDYSDLV